MKPVDDLSVVQLTVTEVLLTFERVISRNLIGALGFSFGSLPSLVLKLRISERIWFPDKSFAIIR